MGIATKREPLRLACITSLVASCILASGAVLAGERSGSGIEGRWENARKDLVLDVRRCGEQYCGRLVTSGDQCDTTVLTVAPFAAPDRAEPAFQGELALPGQRRTYKAMVTMTTAGALRIVGDDRDPSFMRRTFPFYELLSRVGEPRCRSNATS